MLNIMELADLRTKEELINYFEEKGQNITEEEVESLKQSYEQVQENSNTLTMQQLDDVAGGFFFHWIVEHKMVQRTIEFQNTVNEKDLPLIIRGYIDSGKITVYYLEKNEKTTNEKELTEKDLTENKLTENKLTELSEKHPELDKLKHNYLTDIDKLINLMVVASIADAALAAACVIGGLLMLCENMDD